MGDTRWRTWLRHCATSRKVAGTIPSVVTGIFHWHNPSGPHYGPGVDSVSNRNEYQEYFLEAKAAGTYFWQPYHLHVPIVLKSGSLSLLEPTGPVQACNGNALPFLLGGVGGQRLPPPVLPSGKRLGTHCTGGWVGRRVGVDGFGISRLRRDSIPGPSSPYHKTTHKLHISYIL